jgi:hypothetical protein
MRGVARPINTHRPYEPLPPDDADALAKSVRLLIATAPNLPFARTRAETYKIALFQLTESGGGWRKQAPRYRTRAAVCGPATKYQHEHVVERKWLVRALEAHPDQTDEILALAVACLVTEDEHDLLRAHRECFGWDRYIAAGIEVVDAKHDFQPADLTKLARKQRKARSAIGEVP